MDYLDKKGLRFMENYVNNFSPVGHEVKGQKLWLEYIRESIDDIIETDYCSVAAIINPGKEFKVAIEAHADEISWYVNYIDDDGFIYVVKNGGSDPVIAPSKQVIIHTDGGEVTAVFGWTAIQVRNHTKENPKPELDSIFLDCGCGSKKEVLEMGIRPGCVVTYADRFIKMNSHFVGRALDNRVGGVIIARIAHLLKEQNVKLPYTLYIVNSAQEEVGKHGAGAMASLLKPNIAIITDVTHDTSTPGIDKHTMGDVKCGDGPVLTYAPAVHNKLQKMLYETAGRERLPVQLKAATSKMTGTDTDAFAYSEDGIVSALISLPMRYMHTTVEMISSKDVENAIALLFYFLKDLKTDIKFKSLTDTR